ncbi:MAG: hypothetical protein DRN49_00030 [Thaumarchaeota archaeon]|nr:MAG: hypothetical protein DRN49_00030 [Nitrososphaerota archaeon]
MKPNTKIKPEKMQKRKTGMRCPVCDKEIDMFYCDAIFKQTVTSYRVMKDDIEIIDEHEQEAEEERCFCPHCNAEFEMSMNDAEALLKGEAILVDKNTPMEIIEAERETGRAREEVAIIKVNEELFFSHPERYRVIIHHNGTKEMLLFVKRYPIRLKIPTNLANTLKNIKI